jgi:hypothetical protein
MDRDGIEEIVDEIGQALGVDTGTISSYIWDEAIEAARSVLPVKCGAVYILWDELHDEPSDSVVYPSELAAWTKYAERVGLSVEDVKNGYGVTVQRWGTAPGIFKSKKENPDEDQ